MKNNNGYEKYFMKDYCLLIRSTKFENITLTFFVLSKRLLK